MMDEGMDVLICEKAKRGHLELPGTTLGINQ